MHRKLQARECSNSEFLGVQVSEQIQILASDLFARHPKISLNDRLKGS